MTIGCTVWACAGPPTPIASPVTRSNPAPQDAMTHCAPPVRTGAGGAHDPDPPLHSQTVGLNRRSPTREARATPANDPPASPSLRVGLRRTSVLGETVYYFDPILTAIAFRTSRPLGRSVVFTTSLYAPGGTFGTASRNAR